ncbi:hypothetical protein ZWY2020_003145 [Hordeum vulgare]|nr:hypothetical protein ZWY2020_003145 [Hordeum vulgare]
MAASRLALPRLMLLAMLVLLVALLGVGVGVDGRSHPHKKPPRAGVGSRHSRVGASVGTVASSPAIPPDDDGAPPGGIVPSDPATPFRPEPCVFDVRAYGATGESTADDTRPSGRRGGRPAPWSQPCCWCRPTVPSPSPPPPSPGRASPASCSSTYAALEQSKPCARLAGVHR